MTKISSAFFACLVAFGSTPTAAFDDVYSYGSRMKVEPGEGGCFAIVSVENLIGPYHEIERLETSRGFVSIEYQTIGGHNSDDHDIVTVRNLPDGVFADPMRIDLPDGDTGHICLFEGVVS